LADAPYPFYFKPTFHRYRLGEPARMKKPKNIFVCSMADMFGDWVPDEWIKAVFEACEAIPRHRYLFLTKNPARYKALAMAGKLPVLEGQDETVTAEKSEVEPEGPGLTLPVQPKQTI
ncbi:MAG: phage Gp37/Gp68 family protein, partial [Defluviitaleaceae bacterium]|nr:phage Gp37/Gp68 family protein [Defluviitaleaceae bacterium]